MNQQEFNKVLERIYFLPTDWIEKCFASKSWLIPHFQGRYADYCERYGKIGGFLNTWISFDGENRELFYQYINNQLKK